MLRSITAVFVLSVLLAGSGCHQLSDADAMHMIIENDANVLAERVTFKNTIISIDDSVAAAKASFGPGFAPSGNDAAVLTLVAESTPPQYQDTQLQATEVRIKGNKAYVSYNVKGSEFLGAVEIYNITDNTQPELISSAIFTDADVNGLAIQGNRLYLALASANPQFTSPAALEVITLIDGKLSNNSVQIDLPSYAATDVDLSGNFVYVTSGADDGYITVLVQESEQSLGIFNSIALDDARGVDVNANEVAVVAGTPAQLVSLNNTTGNLSQSYTLTGASIENSKSTVEVKSGKAFLGLGDGGAQIVCLADGTVIDSIAQPTVSGLDAAVTVTNSVTAYKRGLFMGNGEAGVYFALADSYFDASNNCTVDNLHLVGKLQFNDLESVNHVVYRKDTLFIASGLGGLKIVTVAIPLSVNNDNEPDDIP
jgi:hypothetical protein